MVNAVGVNFQLRTATRLQEFGIRTVLMRRTRAFDPCSTVPPNSRRTLFDFLRRRWLFGPLVRMSLPPAVILKRRLAPLCVFIFGIVIDYLVRSPFGQALRCYLAKGPRRPHLSGQAPGLAADLAGPMAPV